MRPTEELLASAETIDTYCDDTDEASVKEKEKIPLAHWLENIAGTDTDMLIPFFIVW